MKMTLRWALWAPAFVLMTSCVQVESKPDRDPALCGNGELDSAESCDPAIESGEGACPTSCPDTGDTCGAITLEGDPDECSARCVVVQNSCGASDGCCPSGCTNAQDSDCPIDCNEPANSQTPGCVGSDRLTDLDENGWRAFCDSLTPGEFMCTGETTVEVPPAAECYEGRNDFPEDCTVTVAEAQTCFDNPCALVDGGPECDPIFECAQMAP